MTDRSRAVLGDGFRQQNDEDEAAALPSAPKPDLIAKWREHATEAGRLARKHEQEFDGANAHAFRKERRIWTTCADELETALRAARAGAEAPPPEEP
jgi:hypothetical protein